MSDHELIGFLQWCLPKLQLRWPGFRKVRRTIRKRLTRRIRELGLAGLADYRNTLAADPAEWSFLDKICRIPISRFYRDRSIYNMLTNQVLPDCAARARTRSDCKISILSAGCASGEEPYSVSLVWHLRVAEKFPDCTIDILAVDVDDLMISRAHAACYSSSALKDLPHDLVELGFEQKHGVHCLKDRFRKCVHFLNCDLRRSVPDGPFDLVLCRNTAFTYFDKTTQALVSSKLAAALRIGGYLVTGAHEVLPAMDNDLVRAQPGSPVFRKTHSDRAARSSTNSGPAEQLVINGSHGEGGGQILRSALSLAAITGRPVRVVNIRARRRRPGLAAQHLTAVRAVAAICSAQVDGDELHSEALDFTPGRRVRPGHYVFDVADARKGGSAGSAPLVLQAVLMPLALADAPSQVEIHGGTHVPWSPSFDYLHDIWLPTLSAIGITAEIELARWGWFPAGGGLIRCSVTGSVHPLKPFRVVDKGPIQNVSGRAVAAHLPDHISVRMAQRATTLLGDAGIPSTINADVAVSTSSGAGIFLTAQYARVRGGYCAHGKRGKPAEDVATEAVEQLLAHKASSAALEHHLADQLILPLALADGTSQFSVDRISGHLKTHAWLVEHFGLASVTIERRKDDTGHVRIIPNGIGS